MTSPVTLSPATATPGEISPPAQSPATSLPGKADPSAGIPADACGTDQTCIDQYLWSLYERTPKVDAVTVSEQTKVKVKHKGKTRTVTKTTSKILSEDFAWKDPKAAERAGMAPMDYVIGGMDGGFKLKLYRALRALDDAGFKPGIMCAFRDDYRQSIATGLKAQNDRSFHGGSFRGGYGHGMAADIVSVRGENRTERLASSGQMWDFIDAHEKELGIGRPYLDRDPPHVGPIDGEEYTDHRVKPKVQHAESGTGKNKKTRHAGSETGKNRHSATRTDQGATKRGKVMKTTSAAKPARTPAKPLVSERHTDRRVAPQMQRADSETGKNRQFAVHADQNPSKRVRGAKPSRAQIRSRTPVI